jgi:hypothetical protein
MVPPQSRLCHLGEHYWVIQPYVGRRPKVTGTRKLARPGPGYPRTDPNVTLPAGILGLPDRTGNLG